MKNPLLWFVGVLLLFPIIGAAFKLVWGLVGSVAGRNPEMTVDFVAIALLGVCVIGYLYYR